MLETVLSKAATVALTAALATGGVAAAEMMSTSSDEPVVQEETTETPPTDTVEESDGDTDETTEEVTPGLEGPGSTGETDTETADGNGKSVADDVHAVLADETLSGRDKGQAVAAVASQNRQDGAHRPEGKGKPDDAEPAAE